MRSKITAAHPAAAFERVLDVLAPELVDSTDDELLEAARDPGMNPARRGSAAFVGVKYSNAPTGLNAEELIGLKNAIEHARSVGAVRQSP